MIIIEVSISATKLREALSPFYNYLKELKLENVIFQDKLFDEFISRRPTITCNPPHTRTQTGSVLYIKVVFLDP